MFFKSLAENKKPRQGWIPNKKEIQSLPVASHVVIWFNTPVLYRQMTWQRIYAVCFTSTVPSLCSVMWFGSFVCGFFVLLLGCVDIKANMPPAYFAPDQYCATGCTFGFHSAIGGHMSLGQIAAVRAMPWKWCPGFAVMFHFGLLYYGVEGFVALMEQRPANPSSSKKLWKKCVLPSDFTLPSCIWRTNPI